MRRFELVNYIKELIADVSKQQKEIKENYDMGLITFHEYMSQLADIDIFYNNNLESGVWAVLDQEGVSLDFVRGYLAHECIGC